MSRLLKRFWRWAWPPAPDQGQSQTPPEDFYGIIGGDKGFVVYRLPASVITVRRFTHELILQLDDGETQKFAPGDLVEIVLVKHAGPT